jgi:hypothetical protein
MIKKFWIKSIFTLLILIFSLNTFACGGGWDYRGFTLFFNPFEEAQPKHNYLYNPFSYTYDWNYNYNPPSETDVVIKEWTTALNTNKIKEVRNLIYVNNLEDINALLEAKKRNIAFRKVKLTSKNALYKQLYQNIDLLEYVQLIQDYSYHVNSFGDEWQYAYHTQEADPYKLEKNQQQAEVLLSTLKNKTDRTSAFILPRLYYHLVRSAYFNRNFAKAHNYVQNAPEYSTKNKSIINDWLEGLRGGIALHSNNTKQAILHYAREFNQSKFAHYQAYIDLKWLSNKGNLLDALEIAATKEDSLNIYAAASATNAKLASGLFAKNITYIQDEEIRYFLWYREMQKVEETYFHPKICNQTFERWDDYGEYLKENKNLITTNYADFKKLTLKLYQTCSESNYKSYYANGLAYIQLMDGNYSAELPQEENATAAIARFQRTVFSLYRQVRNNETIDNADVITLLDLWKSDYFKLAENKQTLSYVLRDFVAPHFLYHQKDTLNALFLWGLSDGNYYYWDDEKPTTNSITFTHSEVADVLINYTLSTSQYLNIQNRLKNYDSPFLAWAKTKRIKVTIGESKTNDLLFFKYVRDENWKMAEKELYKSNLSYKKRKYYDPFIVHYDGFLSPTREDSLSKKMNARQFLRLGQKLKTAVIQNPTAENNLKYGQYLLSTTFHGHNSIADDANLGYLQSTWYEFKPWFFDVKKFGTYVGYYYYYESFEFEPSKKELDYYHCYKAEAYFKKAYAKLTDQEEKAKCCFLLAKCVQKRAPIPPMVMNEYGYKEPEMVNYKGEKYGAYGLHSLTNPYLLEMDKLYANTATYKQARSECSYLKYILK